MINSQIRFQTSCYQTSCLFLFLILGMGIATPHRLDAGLFGSAKIQDSSLTGATKKLTSLLEIGATLPEFELKDHDGVPRRSIEWKKATAVVFVGVECPLVKLYSGRLSAYQKKFGDEFQVIAIDSNRQDSLAEIASFVKDLKVDFPILKDAGNVVADAFGAQRTPQVFLFDAQRKLRYRGAIDDQYTYGQRKREAESHFLADAIATVLDGGEVENTSTESDGCIIGRLLEASNDASVTYANQVSRLLNAHCVGCHREGEVAPFSLTDYDEVVGWAEMIAEVTAEKRMPPWHANPIHGTFSNDISLSKEQIELVQNWVNQGAPFGNAADLPEPPKFEQGWKIGKPDVVIAMSDQPYSVPATGEVPYQYFVVETGFTEDKWIEAAECQIGNRAVVHHIIVGLKGGGRQLTHGQIDSEWITATAPGSPPLVLEEGFAKLIPAGAKLVFQVHYTPNGVAQKDLSKVGFKFADPKKVKQSVGTQEVSNTRFRIPPRAENHEVRASFTFKDDSLILSMFPHMHVRGKSFRYTATYPDGQTEILLDIPRYDFNWQNGYQFPEPKLMPAGTKLDCVAHFDNSEKNFSNPDPSKAVRWGDQTWDEMMIGYFDMALANQDLTNASSNPRTESVIKKIDQGEELVDGRVKKLASKALRTDGGMTALGVVAATKLNNLDRICVSTINGGEIEIVRVIQRPEFQQVVGGKGVKTTAEKSMLGNRIKSEEAFVIDDLAAESAADAEFMSKAFGSSFHVPIEFEGKKATINFWSAEPSAFPESIQTRLIELASAMTGK